MAESPNRTLWSKALTSASFILIVLETMRATNAIVHSAEFGGVSFVGLALPGPLVAIGGPIAATIGFLGVALCKKERRVGYAMVLAVSGLFVVTHVLDQIGRPGPSVAEIGRLSGTVAAWVTMAWALASVVCLTLSIYALMRRPIDSV